MEGINRITHKSVGLKGSVLPQSSEENSTKRLSNYTNRYEKTTVMKGRLRSRYAPFVNRQLSSLRENISLVIKICA